MSIKLFFLSSYCNKIKIKISYLTIFKVVFHQKGSHKLHDTPQLNKSPTSNGNHATYLHLGKRKIKRKKSQHLLDVILSPFPCVSFFYVGPLFASLSGCFLSSASRAQQLDPALDCCPSENSLTLTHLQWLPARLYRLHSWCSGSRVAVGVSLRAGKWTRPATSMYTHRESERHIYMYVYTLPLKSLGSLRNVLIFARKAQCFSMKTTLNQSTLNTL